MPDRLAQQPLALALVGGLRPRAPPLGARVLAGHHVAQLVQREPEQVLEAQQLAQPFHVALTVLAMAARRPLARQQAELLVVADGPYRRAGRARQRTDPHLSPPSAATATPPRRPATSRPGSTAPYACSR